MTELCLQSPSELDGAPSAIPLDATLTPQENVASYFARARKLKGSVRKIEGRLETLNKEMAELNKLLEEFREPATGQLHRLESTHHAFCEKGWIQRESTAKKRDDGGELKFREYIVSGNWHVYVGQNDRKNDLLTFRFAKKDDWWFHARGVAGSHVILRRTGRSDNPSRAALEQAASLAAYFSRARTSGLVPVTYTQKKYVRKSRGAAAGEVVVEREEVVVVPPVEPRQPEPAE